MNGNGGKADVIALFERIRAVAAGDRQQVTLRQEEARIIMGTCEELSGDARVGHAFHKLVTEFLEVHMRNSIVAAFMAMHTADDEEEVDDP